MSTTDPNYYKGNKWQTWDVIELYKMGFLLGNAFKYIVRAGNKDDLVVDLKKAIIYLKKYRDTHDFSEDIPRALKVISSISNFNKWGKVREELKPSEDIVCDLATANNLNVRRKNYMRTLIYIAIFAKNSFDKGLTKNYLNQLINRLSMEVELYESKVN